MKKIIYIKQGVLSICLSLLLGGWWGAAQTATLDIGARQPVRYKLGELNDSVLYCWLIDGKGPSLDAETLRAHLTTIRTNCFKELGRLILAQNFPEKLEGFPFHNVSDNNGPGYMEAADSEGYPYREDLCNANTMILLINHLFDHGHMGYYPGAVPITSDPEKAAKAVVLLDPQDQSRGIFNVSRFIREMIMIDVPLYGHFRDQGYYICPQVETEIPLLSAASNLVNILLSSSDFDNIKIGPVLDKRFNIYATYNEPQRGSQPPIPGIDYTRSTVLPLPNNCLGLQRAGTPTNRIRLVVGVDNGKIYIASLFPEG